MKKIILSAFVLLAAASMALAGALDQFKAGNVSFTVLDTDGSSPLSSASIKLISSESGDVVAEATADELGQAVVAIDAGRYVLNISDINLALFDVDAAEGLSSCRVIMPDAALLVGGQDVVEEEEEDSNRKGAAWIWPVAGGIAAVALLVGAGFAIDHNTHHHHHHNAEVLPEPVPTHHRGHHSKPSPSPSAI